MGVSLSMIRGCEERGEPRLGIKYVLHTGPGMWSCMIARFSDL